MLKAVRSLPPAEQDAVLAYLIMGGIGGESRSAGVTVTQKDWVTESPLSDRLFDLTASRLSISGQGDLRTMPVRFPEKHYQRLKSWCGEHGFPMAVVVRGLVERFLDEQAPLDP